MGKRRKLVRLKEKRKRDRLWSFVAMAAINSCNIRGSNYSPCSTPKTHSEFRPAVSSLPFSQVSRPNFGPNIKHFTPSSGLKISYRKKKELEQWFQVPMISCLMEDTSENYPEPVQSSVSKNSQEVAAIDLKLPRRSLLVTFTCNACNARSQRLINRLAYERGLVYVQCSGCSKYHKLVDNLGLVVEYNLQEEIDWDTSKEQV